MNKGQVIANSPGVSLTVKLTRNNILEQLTTCHSEILILSLKLAFAGQPLFCPKILTNQTPNSGNCHRTVSHGAAQCLSDWAIDRCAPRALVSDGRARLACACWWFWRRTHRRWVSTFLRLNNEYQSVDIVPWRSVEQSRRRLCPAPLWDHTRRWNGHCCSYSTLNARWKYFSKWT